MTAQITIAETGPLPGEEIRQFIERAEALEAQKRDLTEDLAGVFAEAKGRGYSVPILKAIIKERKKDRDDLAEEQAIMELYRAALGMD